MRRHHRLLRRCPGGPGGAGDAAGRRRRSEARTMSLRKTTASFRPLGFLAAALGLGLALSACRASGAYPFEYFSEMHYQESYRAGEPQRLQAPERSVPTSGAEESLLPAQLAALQNPLRPTPENL